MVLGRPPTCMTSSACGSRKRRSAQSSRYLGLALTLTILISACTSGSKQATPSAQTQHATGVPRGWTTSTFYGGGVSVTLPLPRDWTQRLPGRSFHYSATFAYLANYPVQQFCGGPCIWADAGQFPMGALLSALVLADLVQATSRPGSSQTEAQPLLMVEERPSWTRTEQAVWGLGRTTPGPTSLTTATPKVRSS